MLKVVVHQGFHKTGTRTLQTMLYRNRFRLKDRVNVLVPRDLKEAGFAARRYSVAPNERTLQKFRQMFRQTLLPFEGQTDAPLLISSEEFAGMIPGRKDVWSYHQTHVLAEVILDEINRFADNKARITFFYTTRDAPDWIKSVYWQNIRGNRIQEDLSEYAELLTPGADLESVVGRVAAQMSSRAEVISLNISGLSDRLFPVTKVLSILNVRSDDLTPVSNLNVQPVGAAEHFLELNRSNMTDEDVIAAKQAYLDRRKAAT